MNKYQIRCIRAGFNCDKVYPNYIIKEPIMGKTLNDVIPLRLDKKPYIHYILTKGNHKYVLASFSNDKLASTLYVITHNDKIIYCHYSPIFAGSSSAWHIITQVYHGYNQEAGIWRWKSVEDFDCHYGSDWYIQSWYKPWFQQHLSDYRKEMYDKYKKNYIDKSTITVEEENELLNNLYYHV